jgi:hypothetical protein
MMESYDMVVAAFIGGPTVLALIWKLLRPTPQYFIDYKAGTYRPDRRRARR